MPATMKKNVTASLLNLFPQSPKGCWDRKGKEQEGQGKPRDPHDH